MKTSYALFIACMLATVLQSCTSVLYINTTLPPEVSVTDEQWKVVTVNRLNPALLPFNREKKVDTFHFGANEAVHGATDAIIQDSTFSLAGIDTSGNYMTQEPGQALNREQVQAIYQQYPHHLILALENLEAFFNQETVREKDEDGTVNKTAHYTLHTRTSWALYDSTGAILDKVTLSRASLYQSRGVISGLLAVGPSLANAGAVINQLAWQTGQDYWSRMHPKPINFERPYYSDKEFAPAAFSMAGNEWDKAISLLTPIAESRKRKNAAKAAYNLAVVHEAKGEVASAKKWAKIAAEQGNKLALLLLPDLERYDLK